MQVRKRECFGMNTNPFQAPPWTEMVDADFAGPDEIRVPPWGRVIINAALMSLMPGVFTFAAIIFTRGILLPVLAVLMPFGFAWYFCQTYGLPYRCVPKFGWLPWAFFLSFAFIAIIVGLMLTGLSRSVASLFQYNIESGRYLPDAVAGSVIAGAATLAMDYTLSNYLPRSANLKRTLLWPSLISLGVFLPSLAVVYFWRTAVVPEFPQIRSFPVLSGMAAAGGLILASFYSLVLTHPSVRDRIASARRDPRKFRKSEFHL